MEDWGLVVWRGVLIIGIIGIPLAIYIENNERPLDEQDSNTKVIIQSVIFMLFMSAGAYYLFWDAETLRTAMCWFGVGGKNTCL